MYSFFIFFFIIIFQKAHAQALPGMVGGEGTLKLGTNTASVEKEEAAYYNPAGLSNVSTKISTGSTLVGISQNKEIEADRYFTAPSLVALATPTAHGAYSFYFASTELIKAGYDVDLSDEYNKLNKTKNFKYKEEMQINQTSIAFGLGFGKRINSFWSWGYNLEVSNQSSSIYQDKNVYRYDDNFNKTESRQSMIDYEVSSWMLQPGFGIQFQKPRSFGFGLMTKIPSVFLMGNGKYSWKSSEYEMKNDNQVRMQDFNASFETKKITQEPFELRLGFYHFLTTSSYIEYNFKYTDIAYQKSVDGNVDRDFLFYDQESSIYLNKTSFSNSDTKEKTSVSKKISVSYTQIKSDSTSYFASLATVLPDEAIPYNERSTIYLMGLGLTETINLNYKTTLGVTYLRSEANSKADLVDRVLKDGQNLMSVYQALVFVVAGSYYY